MLREHNCDMVSCFFGGGGLNGKILGILVGLNQFVLRLVKRL